jgi:(5-formylfuran-3-yl)methyl phosphate synthase
MMRVLVSVRDVHEALAAAQAGAHFIDLKDPASGALGGLPPRRIARIVQALRASHPGVPVSATIGDVAAGEHDEILRRVANVAACGVDYVKVGVGGAFGGTFANSSASPPASAVATLLQRLAGCGTAVVPVLIVDHGIDAALVRAALRERAFPALMLDTFDKRGGSLLQRIAPAALAAFVETVRSHGCLAGLAGALRADDVPALVAFAPDFGGFRSAVCRGDRAGALDPALVRGLFDRLAARASPRGLAPAAS